MDALKQRLAAMPPERVAELLRRARGAATSSAAEPAPAESGTAEFPLSPCQQRVWLHHSADPATNVYALSVALRLRGQLDDAALERSLQLLVDRHEPLRTIFPVVQGEPVQRILPGLELHVDRRTASAGDTVQEFVARPFDVERGPLLRALLVNEGPLTHVLVVVVHHLVFDAWSLGVFLDELCRCYAALTAGETPALPELSARYADIAAWQRARLSGARLETLREFWLEQLREPIPKLALPYRRAESEAVTRRAQRIPVVVPEGLTRALSDLARQCRATLFSVLLGGLNAVLFRYTGQHQIQVGVPTHGRLHPGAEALVGFFVHNLLLRVSVEEGVPFAALVERVHKTLLRAEQHQELPYEQLLQALRAAGAEPVVQVVFALQNVPLPAFKLAGVELEIWQPDPGTSSAELELHVWPRNSRLEGHLSYATDRFDERTARAMVDHWLTLLEAATRGPDTCIERLPLCSAAELAELRAIEEPRFVQRPAATLHGVFEARVDREPDAPALHHDQRQLTYRQAEEAANRLAHRLLRAGVQREACVALCLPPSLELYTSLLGILKSGAAYVPLDPAQPAERLRQFVTDCGARHIVTSTPHGATFADLDATVLTLDTLQGESCARPDIAVPSESLAYVMYTSGSTGTPKGVLIEHGGVLDLLGDVQARGLVPERARAAAWANVSFDVSVYEAFTALAQGGSIDIVPDALRADVPGYLQWIGQRSIRVAFLPPFLLTELLSELEKIEHCPLEVLGVGLERMPETLIARILRAVPGLKVANGYGPTETSICATLYDVPRRRPLLGNLSIGTAVAATRLRVLDAQGQRVPFGIPGELHVGGRRIARGYLGRPELTRARFIPDPEHPGERLYRTGDRVRWSRQGELEFLGRNDDQLKVGGVRVEPGEVRAALLENPVIGEAAVVPHERAGVTRLVAYVTPRAGAESDALEPARLRADLQRRLPPALIPAAFVRLERLPLTANGKLDRRALPPPDAGVSLSASDATSAKTDGERRIAAIWCELLGVASISTQVNFMDVGGSSLLLVKLRTRLEALAGRAIPLPDLFRCPTIATQAELLFGGAADEPRLSHAVHVPLRTPDRDIAIVGMACRLPDADDVHTFWKNLQNGVHSIRPIEREELLRTRIGRALAREPAHAAFGTTLADIEAFDASYFGYSPAEAALLDPQQRLFLECAVHALEDACCVPERQQGAVGVFAGAGLNTYLLHVLAADDPRRLFEGTLANDKDFLASRVSYKLGLQGPSLTVQTACSTGLSAVHLACQSLRLGECRLALAGASSVRVRQNTGYTARDGFLAPDGTVRAFDRRARGMVPSSGVVVLVLQPLRAALEDGAPIYAVIRGSAWNNDGADKLGYTAPSERGQTEVIRRALADAGVSADDIDVVEAHGTGTALGDPIEFRALQRAFAPDTKRRSFCALGSVKTNVGHTDSAAGAVGLMKAALALAHEQIPPTLHFEQPNPEIDLTDSPFLVNTAPRAWTRGERPRRAGVSSFGIGGTNVHVVLEEAPLRPAPVASRPAPDAHLLVLSAHTVDALDRYAAALASTLEARPELELEDVAYSLQVGRQRHAQRRALVCTDRKAAITALRNTKTVVADERSAPALCLMFPGQGTQYAHMGRRLREAVPSFGAHLDAAIDACSAAAGWDLRGRWFDDARPVEELERELASTALTQPALFCIEYALARTLLGWGVRPRALVGHSVGEYAAACIAGIFTLEAAAALVVERGRLIAELPRGAMLSVALSEAELANDLPSALSIAAVNGARQCTVAGAAAALQAFAAALSARGVATQPLRTSHAFHSTMMDPAVEPMRRALAAKTMRAPELPVVSAGTGTWLTNEQATDPEYWARQLREPVRFARALETLCELAGAWFVEVGPGATLSALAQARLGATQRSRAFGLLPRRGAVSEQQQISATLGALWCAGAELDWHRVHEGRSPRKVSLPGYAFERKRYWIEPAERGDADMLTSESAGTQLYVPSFQRLPPLPPELPKAPERWLVLADDSGVADALCHELRSAEHEVQCVRQADSRTLDFAPTRIVHCFGVAEPSSTAGLTNLALLAKALDAQLEQPATLTVVTSDAMSVLGDDPVRPEAAAALGAVLAITQQSARLTAHVVDVEHAADFGADAARRVLAECVADGVKRPIAHRRAQRWGFTVEPLQPPASKKPPIEARCTLVTGGLSGVGLAIASHLARVYRTPLVLLGRRALPDRAHWQTYIDDPSQPEAWRESVRALLELEAAGCTVQVERADVTDRAQLAGAIERARARFGSIAWVVHAAGSSDAHWLAALDPECIEQGLSAKVRGARLLEELLDDDPPQGWILCSSLAAVLGGGSLPYCAANAFLDAFAVEQQQRGRRVLAVAWDRWRDTGAGARAGAAAMVGPGLVRSEALQGLDALLRSSTSQAFVAHGDLRARLEASASLRFASVPARSAALEPRPALSTPYRAPESALEQQLCSAWGAALGIEGVGMDDDFFDLGGTSLMALQLTAELQRELGRNLPSELLVTHASPARFAEQLARLERGGGESLPNGASVLRPGKPETTTFWLHPAGGSLYSYRELVSSWAGSARVIGLDLPLNGGAPRTVASLAQTYAEMVRAISPEGPCSLLGYSYGGWLACELAVVLGRAGRPVSSLILLDAPLPTTLGRPFHDEADMLAYLCGQREPIVPETLRALEGDARLERALAHLRAQGLLAPGFGRAELATLLRTFAVDVRAQSEFLPQAMARLAEARRYTRVVHVRAKELRAFDPPRTPDTFRELARAGVQCWECDGNHFTMMQRPHVARLAARIEPVLFGSVTSQSGERACSI